jgi:ribosome-associated protein
MGGAPLLPGDTGLTPSIVISEDELDERFVRASGPGGQNVNKVSTAVELRFNVGASSLPEDVKARLAALLQQASLRPKKRRKTKPSKAARERRLTSKVQRSRVKAHRARVRRDED